MDARHQELETAVRQAWRLLGDLNNHLLRSDGLRAERYAEIARDVLADALGEPRGFRGMRTKANEPAPRDELDEAAERVMARGGPRATTQASTKELEAAAREVWLLLGGAGHWNTIITLLQQSFKQASF